MHPLYVSAAHLLTAAWAADTHIPRKLLMFFFPSSSHKMRTFEKAEGKLSARIEKHQLNIQCAPLAYRSAYKSEGKRVWIFMLVLRLFT